MPSHTENRILPYSADQMFDLVMDVEKYPEFLPWCLASRINKRFESNIEADVIVGYKVFRESFSSRVHFTKGKEVEVEYLKGPMRHLHNKWSFKDVGKGACQVEFYVDFSLNAKILEVFVDQFFHRALVKMINAFEERAVDLYGA